MVALKASGSAASEAKLTAGLASEGEDTGREGDRPTSGPVPERPPPRARRGGLRSDAAQQREQAIDRLVADAAQRGDCTDRFYWMLVYDLEMAPMTSNLKQLTDLGIAVAPPEELDDRALQAKLWEVVETLGDLGVYLLHTDSLSDRELYARLVHEILVEPVRDLPPTDGVSEFIDLCAGREPEAAKVDRDRFLPKPQA
ncbi:MAG: hypothetical protein K8R92_04445 [Planctomycetes bacterium]|nr:hypothetical protein [Planctomycetota bacterium]